MRIEHCLSTVWARTRHNAITLLVNSQLLFAASLCLRVYCDALSLPISIPLPSSLPPLTLLPVSPSFHHLRSENDDFVVSTPNRSASSSASWSGPGTSGSAPQSTPRCSTPHTPGSQSHSSGYGTPTGSGLRRKDLSFGFAADSDEGSSLFGTPFGTPRGERGDRSDCDESPGSSTW